MSGSELRLLTQARADTCRLPADSPEADDGVVFACDWGPELDKAARRVNVARRDPWFARAVEATADPRLGVDRAVVYGRLLQLFALAGVESVVRKLMPDRTFDAVLLHSASSPDGEADVVSWQALTGARGRESLRRARLQCIGGNGPALLSGGEHRLSRLLERFGRAVDQGR